MTEIITYPDRDALNMGLADALASDLRMELAANDRVTLAVPGGTTPGPVFDILSAAPLEWDRVQVMLSDERWVPESSPRSNTALLRARLMTGPAAAARMVPLYADGAPEEEVPALAAGIEDVLPLSVLLLGMGADMHTASLFPGAAGLEAALAEDAPALCLLAPDSQPERRVTLPARVLNSAIQKHLVIIGPEKRAALDRAQGLSPAEAPIRAVMQGLKVHWAETE